MKQVLPKVIWEERVALAQLCNKVPIGYNGTPQILPENCPFTFNDYHFHLIHSPHSQYQRESGSNQPFCHSTLSRHTHTDRPTDRPTDGIGDRSTPLVLTLAMLIGSGALKYVVIRGMTKSSHTAATIYDQLL